MASREAPSTDAEGPVDRAFRVLQIVVAAGEPLGVREIGRRAGLPRSTASRLAGQLERLRMVGRTGTGEVVPGSALATLQPEASAMPLLSDRIRPLLVELAKSVGEDAALAVDDGDALLYVDHAASDNAVSVSEVAGERHEFHLVAPGLVAMAQWDADRLDRYLQGALQRATKKSVVEPAQIRSRLSRIANDGVVWTDEEHELGINGLAIAVDLDGDVKGFLSVYGPSYRFSPELRPTLADEFIELVNLRLG